MTKSRRNYGSGSIRQRGKNRWQVLLDWPPDPVTGARRQRSWTVKGSRRDADRFLAERRRERDYGIAIDPQKLTVAAFLLRWLPNYVARRNLKDSTYQRYDEMLRGLIIPRLGHVRLQDLTAEHVRGLMQPDEHRGSSTLVKYFRLLKRALADAVQASLIAVNPCTQVEAPRPRRPSEKRVLDETEVTALFNAVRGSAIEMPVRLALATGMRQGELLALRWDDIDWGSRALTIRRSARRLKDQGVVMTDTKSKNGLRRVELSRRTLAQLQAHRTRQAEHRLRVGPAWQDHGLVFPSQAGTPWDADNLYRAYRRCLDDSGIQDPQTVNWHSLRHSAASLWIRADVDLLTISRRLGHATTSFTLDTYGHLLPGQQRAAAEVLDHLL